MALLNDDVETSFEYNYKTNELEKFRKNFIEIFQQIRQKYPDLPLSEVSQFATLKTLEDAPKSRAVRKMQATRKFIACKSPFVLFNTAPDFSVNSVQENNKSTGLDENQIIIRFL